MEISPLQELKNLAYENRIKDLEKVVTAQTTALKGIVTALSRLTDGHLALKACFEDTLEKRGNF